MNTVRWAAIVTMSLLGCSTATPLPVETVATASPAATVRALRAQLAGHLERAHGCFGEARLRDPSSSGLVRYGFTIEPDGHVAGVEVAAWSEDREVLAGCVRARLTSLYFAPAPPRAVRIERSFSSCAQGRGLCPLGLVVDGEGAELLESVREGLAERDDDLEACASRHTGEALLDVRLEVDEDGRIMAGRLAQSAPARSELARCAVGPLLGARVAPAPAEAFEVRYLFRLGAEERAGEVEGAPLAAR